MMFGGHPIGAAPVAGSLSKGTTIRIVSGAPLPISGMALEHVVYIDVLISAGTPLPAAMLALEHALAVKAVAVTPTPTALSMRLFHDWINTATALQQTPIYILELSAPGEATVRLPLASFQGRRRDGEPSYLQVTVPNAPAWADVVTARQAGQLVLYSGIRLASGTEILEEIGRANLELIQDTRGGNSQTIVLSGHATDSNTAPRVRTLAGVTYRSAGTGKRRYRCRLDPFLRPGDTAVIPGYAEQIAVGLITYVVAPRQTTMEITEA
jgi:hypothetical protein